MEKEESQDVVGGEQSNQNNDYDNDSYKLDNLTYCKDFYQPGRCLTNYYEFIDDLGSSHFYNKYNKKIYIEKPDTVNISEPLDTESISEPTSCEEFNSIPKSLIHKPRKRASSINEIFKIPTKNYRITSKYLQMTDIHAAMNFIIDEDRTGKNLIIISPPNTGKTSTIINYLKSIKQKFIFLVPLRFQVKQLSKDKEIGTLLGGDRKDVSDLINNYSYIVTTYDSFSKLNSEISNVFEYYFIVDEFHKIVSDINYRTGSLNYIYENLFMYQRFIGLTGTPYGCINKSLLKQNVELIEFEKTEKSSPLNGNYNIISYDKKLKFPTFYTHLKSNISKGLTLVFINDIKLLEKVRDLLVSDNIISQKEALMITAKRKDEPEIVEMISNERVKSSTKVIFATSIMSTGINLRKTPLENLYVLDESNLIEIIQLIFRFRDGITNVFDFVPTSNYKKNLFDLDEEISELTKAYQKIAKSIQDIYTNYFFLLGYYVEKSRGKLIQSGNLYLEDNEVKINENKIIYDALSKLHDIAYENPRIREEYLKLYGFDQITLINENKNQEKDLSVSIKVTNQQKEQLQTIVLNLLSKKHRKFISYIKQKEIIDPYFFKFPKSSDLNVDIPTDEYNDFDDKFYNTLSDEIVINTVSDFLIFYRIGLSAESSVSLAKANKLDKIVNAIRYLRLVPFLKLSNYQRQKFDQVVRNEIRFIEEVSKYIDNQESISDFSSLITLMKQSGGDANLIKHFSTSVKERLSWVYNIHDSIAKKSTGKKRKSDYHKYKFIGFNTAKDLFRKVKITASQQDMIALNNYLIKGDPGLFPTKKKSTTKEYVDSKIYI